MTTAVMTNHARDRCAEMKISTKVAKAIVRNAEVRYASKCENGTRAMVALWTGEPRYAVVYLPDKDVMPVVLTVIFNSQDFYQRNGENFISVTSGDDHKDA